MMICCKFLLTLRHPKKAVFNTINKGQLNTRLQVVQGMWVRTGIVDALWMLLRNGPLSCGPRPGVEMGVQKSRIILPAIMAKFLITEGANTPAPRQHTAEGPQVTTRRYCGPLLLELAVATSVVPVPCVTMHQVAIMVENSPSSASSALPAPRSIHCAIRAYAD
jgi:hypothetical protein